MAVDPRVGQFSSNYAEEPNGTGSDGVCFPDVLDVDPLQARRNGAGVANVNRVVPVSEAETRLQSPLGPGGLMGLIQVAGVNHGICLRFNREAPGGR